MAFTVVTWAYQEVVSSSKLNLMCANDNDLKARLDVVQGTGDVAAAALPFQASWSAFTGATATGGQNWQGCTYQKRNGIVIIQGAVTKSTLAAAGDVIAILPAGARPAIVTFLASGGNNVAIYPDGRIVNQSGTGQTFGLAGTFAAV